MRIYTEGMSNMLRFIPVVLLLVSCASLGPLLDSRPAPTATAPAPTQSGGDPGGIELPPAWTATMTSLPTVTGTPKPTATGTLEPVPTWIPCEDAPSSQLHAGDTAVVSQAPFLPKELRDSPSAETGDVIGALNPLEEIEVLSGPVCAENLVWWEIESIERALDGWMPEGDEDNAWIIPLP